MTQSWLLWTCLIIGISSCSRTHGPIEGRIIDQAGNPIAHAEITLECEFGLPMHPQSFRWVKESDFTIYSADDGSFKIPDPQRDGKFRVVASSPGTTKHVQEVERGYTEIQLALQPGWSVQGKVLWDDLTDSPPLQVQFHSKENHDDPYNESRMLFETSDDDFSSGRMADGSWLLTVVPVGGSHALFEMNLELEPGGGVKDVGVIDLREKIHRVTLKIISEDPPFNLGTSARDSSGRQIAYEKEGFIHLFFTEPSLDVELFSSGYRNVVLKDLSRDREVSLVKGIPIELSFDSVSGISERMWEEIVLVLQEDRAEGYRFPGGWNGQSHTEFTSSNILVPKAGTYRVVIGLVDFSDYSDSSPLRLPMAYFTTEANAPTITVLDTNETQHFHLSLDQQAVTAAIRRMQKMEMPKY